MGPTIEMLNDLAASWSGSILRATWQGGLAIVAAWILVRCRPGLPPRVACWVWRLADLKLIVALLWSTPLLLPLLPPFPQLGPTPETTAPAPDPRPNPSVGPEPATDLSDEPATTPASSRPSPACMVLMIWLSGVVGAAILAGREALAVSRLRRSCLPIDRPDLRDASTGLAHALGLRRAPDLRAGTAVARPMLVGAFRPAILLPVEMLRNPRSAAAIRPVLAHELAHIRRGDLWWSGLEGLVRALFFFHPLVWLAHREALVAREAACDALALRASGVRPSEYAWILLDIAAGGLARPSRWTATLGMAGSAGSLKRRLIAMKTTQQPSRRQLLSWAFALLAAGLVGLVPWQLVPSEVLAQDPTAKEAAHDGKDQQAPAKQPKTSLQLAESRLKAVQAQLKVAQDVVKQAEAKATAAAAYREYREKQRDRMIQLDKEGAVEHRLVDEQEGRLREAQAAEHESAAKVAVARASLKAAQAAVREAEALRDIALAESRIVPPKAEKAPTPPSLPADVESDLKKARSHLREARLDRARAEREAARAEIGQAEASLKKAKATVEYRTKLVERFKQLLDVKAIQKSLVDEQEQLLTEARNAEQVAASAIELARARLKAAEVRVKSAEAGAANRGP